MAALVLAGGEARRMGGGDKTLLPLAGRPILAHVLERLDPARRPVAISANGDPSRFAGFACPVLPDETPGLGPLAGLLAGLAWARGIGASSLLTVPGDTPFLPPDLDRRLHPAPAMAASAGQVHPPIALWPAGCEAALRRFLAEAAAPADRRVSRFADRLAMRVVVFEDGPDGDPFADIDTPSDLVRAGRQLR